MDHALDSTDQSSLVREGLSPWKHFYNRHCSQAFYFMWQINCCGKNDGHFFFKWSSLQKFSLLSSHLLKQDMFPLCQPASQPQILLHLIWKYITCLNMLRNTKKNNHYKDLSIYSYPYTVYTHIPYKYVIHRLHSYTYTSFLANQPTQKIA